MLVGHLFRHFIFSARAGSLVRRIAWLSMIGITISVTAFLIVLFVMNGMNASIRKRIVGLEPHIYLQVAGVSNAQALEAHPVIQRVRETPENRAYVYETQDVILRSQDGQFRGGVARGVTRESLAYFVEQMQSLERQQTSVSSSPTYFTDPQEVPEEGEILIGVDLAQSLGVFEGDYVTIVSPAGLLLPTGETPKFERVRIKRIITTSLADIDAKYLFYQRGRALTALDNEGLKQMGIEVWLGDESKLEGVKSDLLKFDGVSAETWMDRNSALLYALMLEKLTIGTFLGLAGLIAASSILTVLALLLSQKKRDIAVLRTIGFSGKQTVKTFTLIGFFLGGVGVLAGVIIGTSVGLYLEANPIQFDAAAIYYDPTLPAAVDFSLVGGVLLIAALVVWFGAYIPARTASEVQPSDTLRMR